MDFSLCTEGKAEKRISEIIENGKNGGKIYFTDMELVSGAQAQFD